MAAALPPTAPKYRFTIARSRATRLQATRAIYLIQIPTMTHSLLPGSEAIDAGENAASTTFDQRGTPFRRVDYGKSSSTVAVADIGAYEVQSPKVFYVIPNAKDDMPGQRSMVRSIEVD